LKNGGAEEEKDQELAASSLPAKIMNEN